MAIINYISECKAFCDYASEERLNDNEVVLWHALFNLVNLRATSNSWPEAFIPITNAKVLSMTPWGSGNAAVEKLRRTRDRLVQRGLLAYEAGERRKRAPMYQLRYFHPQAEEGFTPSNVVKGVGNGMGNGVGKGVGNGVDIKEKDRDLDPEPLTHSLKEPQEDARAGAAAWARATTARPGGYRRADATEAPCRFDAGWISSTRARGAVAQRLIDAWEGEQDVPDLWGALVDLMQEGLPPELVEDTMPEHDRASLLLARLQALHGALGYAGQHEGRERAKRWAVDLAAAGGDAELAQRMRRLRGEDQESEAYAWP